MPKTSIIEVCLLIYQRPHRFPEILEQLKAQTIQNFRVNIWNNSREKLDISGFPEDRIMLINSEKNVGSQARYKLAKQTTGNPIIFFDDDKNLNPNFVEYHYDQYLKFGPNYLLGEHTRIFKGERYWASGRASYGQEVDYVATLVLDRKIIDEEPLLLDIPEPFTKVEDLYLCYLARTKYGMKIVKIDPAFHDIVDGKDQFLQLKEYKEIAFKELRKMGWKLLRDRHE